jgi:hypothetical protein
MNRAQGFRLVCLMLSATGILPIGDAPRAAPIGGHRFTVLLPVGWVRLDRERGRWSRVGFLIATSRDRVEGVGLTHDDAEISVLRVRDRRLAEVADRLARGEAWFDPVLSTHNLPARVGAEPGCPTPSEVVSRDEMGPRTMMIVTDLLCRVGGSRFLISLRYWEGDPRAAHYRALVHRVARSIRFE